MRKKTPNKQERGIPDLVKRNKLIIVASCGVIFALIFAIAFGRITKTPSNSLRTPVSSPFEHNIAGIGVVEASSKNINLCARNPGVISEVLVHEGDSIKSGDILFKQDNRAAMIDLSITETKLSVARKDLASAKIQKLERNDKYMRASKLKATKNISDELFEASKVASEKADIEVLVKEKEVEIATHQTELARVKVDDSMIKSPIDGIVLRIRSHEGEFVNGADGGDRAPILIGANNFFYLNVKIDENDLWRFNKAAQAIAYLRGNPSIKSKLTFVRMEPYADKKDQLKGVGVELIDTRIVNLLYKIEENTDKMLIGQQLDVFIESKEGP